MVARDEELYDLYLDACLAGRAVTPDVFCAEHPDGGPALRQRIEALHRMLERQHYRLAYWRVSVSAINYRRFFDINDLAGLRVEDPRTFRAVHAFVARLIAQGHVQGLRIDHIDGLWDPLQYTRRLQQVVRNANVCMPPTRCTHSTRTDPDVPATRAVSCSSVSSRHASSNVSVAQRS